MHNVIDFAAHLNARRAGATIADREQAKLDRIERKVDHIVDTLETKFGRPMPVGAQIAVMAAVEQAEAAQAPKFMPAYCDPSNETRGSMFEATRHLPLTDIAKRMRADIKALGLPAGFKVSVRVRHHNAIDISVTALPAGFQVLSDKAASWRKQFGEWRDYPFAHSEARSAELGAILDKLNRIHGAYNRNNSDSMSDYFDVRYYGWAEVDSQARREREAEQIAANAGSYWAADA